MFARQSWIDLCRTTFGRFTGAGNREYAVSRMVTSRPVLYLHCGVHRTGTTMLQHCFSENRKLLREHGIEYPFTQLDSRSLAGALRDGSMTGEELVARLESVRSDDSTRLLLSCEDFASIRSSDWLVRLHGAFDVRIVFYLRRQDLWWNSWYNQNIKCPWDERIYRTSPREFLAFIDDCFWIDYHSLLTRWAGIVGKKNLLLGIVGRRQITDVVPDALEKIGLDPRCAAGRTEADAWNSNKSISPLALEVLRHIDLLQFEPGIRLQVIRAVVQATEVRQKRVPKMVYRPSERREIMKRFEESNARVAREFFGRKDGRLFLDANIRDDDPYTNVELPSAEVLLDKIVAPVLKELINLEPGKDPDWEPAPQARPRNTDDNPRHKSFP